MSVLSSLKIVELKPRPPKAVGNRRLRFLKKIDEQILLAEEAIGKPEKRASKSCAMPSRSSKPVTRWWHDTFDGKILLTLRYSHKPMELSPGKAAIECEDMSGVRDALKLIRQAVLDGEFDALLSPERRLGEKAAREGQTSGCF
jgi:hypothetical protein